MQLNIKHLNCVLKHTGIFYQFSSFTFKQIACTNQQQRDIFQVVEEWN